MSKLTIIGGHVKDAGGGLHLDDPNAELDIRGTVFERIKGNGINIPNAASANIQNVTLTDIGGVGITFGPTLPPQFEEAIMGLSPEEKTALAADLRLAPPEKQLKVLAERPSLAPHLVAALAVAADAATLVGLVLSALA